jgi:CBS domain-containing protein
MFSVYGVAGQSFRGTLEQVAELPGVVRARHVRAIAQEGEGAGSTLIPRLDGRQGGGHGGHPGGSLGTRETIPQLYQDVLEPEQARGPLTFASQIMNRDVMVLDAEIPAPVAWRTLLARGFSQAPVLDAAGVLVGLVTERDLLTTFNLERQQARTPLSRHVSDVMRSPVVCAEPDTDIRRVARMMLEFHLPALPVVTEARSLIGLISRGDILRAVCSDPPLSLWG